MPCPNCKAKKPHGAKFCAVCSYGFVSGVPVREKYCMKEMADDIINHGTFGYKARKPVMVLMDYIFQRMRDELKQGREVQITKFGVFYPHTVAAHKFRKPPLSGSKDWTIMPAITKIKFSAYSKFEEK